MYELEKENLRRLSDHITKILRPSLIKNFMTTYMEKDVVELILSEESRSVTRAAQMFLDQICSLEERGWFQAFKDILLSAEYTGLHSALLEWNFLPLEELHQHRKLLERIEPSLTKHIKPGQLLPHMSLCLTLKEREEIQATEAQRGPIAASEKLLDCLIRSDKPNWFKLLKTSLDACELYEALELLESDEGVKSESSGDSSGTQTLTTFSIQYREEPENENESNVNFPEKPSNTPTAESGAQGEHKLREYQKELMSAAIKGQNTIICAPTGSGKTIVALGICDDHIQQFPERAKIVFLATKVDVYEQQYKLFLHYFSRREIRVTGMCGDMPFSLRQLLETHDIVVMTAQILVNALQKQEVTSLGMLTLILLDECHNTTGKHPYNNIMTRYCDEKLAGIRPLPQIVGLTASVGVGSFKTKEDAATNISQLCANMDSLVISTVNTHLDDLRTYVHTPEKEFFHVPQPISDSFCRIIKNIMRNIELMASNTYNIENLSNLQKSDFGSQKYEQWIVSIQKSCRVLQMENEEEERRVCRELCNYTEHLRKYNDALIISLDARCKDALDYLDHFFEQVRNAEFDHTERKLAALFDRERAQLQILASEGQESPKLEELRFILEEEYHNNVNTRTVMFVRTRALAEAMKKWIDETESLKFLNPGVLIGKGRKSNVNSIRMTGTNQKGVLDSFKSSDQSKLLIATSVAEEGIDIPQCNLVLMYEYAGNVVKMVQVRGRGRAQGSRCFLISSSSELIEKEKLNLLKESMVEKAVTDLQSNPVQLQRVVERLQRGDKQLRDFHSCSPKKPKTEESFQLLCGKCKKFACLSDNLRVIQESQHIVLDRSMFSRSIRAPHKKPISFCGFVKKEKLLCGDCKQDWGIVVSYLNIPELPLLKIESFVVQHCITKKQDYFRKWKEVTFAIREFDMNEITADMLRE